jgi:hypothetical protein
VLLCWQQHPPVHLAGREPLRSRMAQRWLEDSSARAA